MSSIENYVYTKVNGDSAQFVMNMLQNILKSYENVKRKQPYIENNHLVVPGNYWESRELEICGWIYHKSKVGSEWIMYIPHTNMYICLATNVHCGFRETVHIGHIDELQEEYKVLTSFLSTNVAGCIDNLFKDLFRGFDGI